MRLFLAKAALKAFPTSSFNSLAYGLMIKAQTESLINYIVGRWVYAHITKWMDGWIDALHVNTHTLLKKNSRLKYNQITETQLKSRSTAKCDTTKHLQYGMERLV